MTKDFRSSETLFDLYARIYREPYHAFLHSSMPTRTEGRYSYMGCRPAKVFSCRKDAITVFEGGTSRSLDGNPFEALQSLMRKTSSEHTFFQRGAIGYWGYDLKDHLEDLPSKAVPDLRWFDGLWMLFDAVLVMDHFENRLFFAGDEHAIQSLEKIVEKPVRPERTTAFDFEIRPQLSKSSYLEKARRIKEHISQGDVYEVNLTQRFDISLSEHPWNGYQLFKALCEVSPSPYSAYLSCGDYAVISSSPEQFLQVIDNTVVSKPIKGTRPRSTDFWKDETAYLDLITSEKDRAENVMIVDLVRNDLSRVSKPGTVKADSVCRIESFETVFQMVSTIRSVLDDSNTSMDAIRACFPPGSMTGAPKIAAMKIVEELEDTKRGIYSGALGYLEYDGSCNLSVIIRTLILKGNSGYFQTGGAIVWDSDPELEYNECWDKARGILKALECLRA